VAQNDPVTDRGAERFDVRGVLGHGGMGVVHRGFDRRFGREVALKTLRQVTARDLFRFKREFRALADIVHPTWWCCTSCTPPATSGSSRWSWSRA
jgi:serine/threonine protein kinase